MSERTTGVNKIDKTSITKAQKPPSKREFDYSASITEIKKKGVKLWSSSDSDREDEWN